MFKIIWTTAVLAALAAGQTEVDLRTQSKSVDFSAASSTKPVTTGTALPATCGVGQMFFLSNAPAGQNVYGCTATNTWTVQSGGSGGGGSVTVQSAGTPVGSNSTLNFSGGAGILYAISNGGSAISIQTSSNTAVTPTLASEQTDGVRLCASASGSTSAYTCSLSPTLMVYTTGMVLNWKADLTASGGALTLNIDTLGAIALKTADGLTNPLPGDIIGGRMQQIWFDGTVFRLLSPALRGSLSYCASASGSGTAYTCAGSPTLNSYVTGAFLDWRPDVSATGAATLNVDALGAKSVKLADGTTDPAPGDILAGRLQQIWFDGTVFRLLNPASRGVMSFCGSASGSATAYTCAGSPTLYSYTTGMVLNWKPDVSGAGGATTLNVDTLGATPVKQPDGVTDPALGDLLAGRLQQIWFDGSVFRLVSQVVPPGVRLCTSSSGSATAYTCAASPTLYSYTNGMVLNWKPDVSGTGGATTLNVDALGVTPVKLPDGATNPSPGDIVAGRLQQLWFDGSSFRLLSPLVPAGVLGDALPTCGTGVRGRLWFVAGATGVKDSLSVCAKDASNAYAWRTIY